MWLRRLRHGYAKFGYATWLRYIRNSVTPCVTPACHFPRHSARYSRVTPSATPRVTPASSHSHRHPHRHPPSPAVTSPRHSPRHSSRHSTASLLASLPRPRVFAASTYENSSYPRVRPCGSLQRPASTYVSTSGRRSSRPSTNYTATTRPSQTSHPASSTWTTPLQSSSRHVQSIIRILRPSRNSLSCRRLRSKESLDVHSKTSTTI